MLLTAIKKTNTLPESLAKGELGTADEKLTSREIINHSPKCLLVIKLLNYQLNKRKKRGVFFFFALLYQYVIELIRAYAHTCKRFTSFTGYAFASAVSNITGERSTVSQSISVWIWRSVQDGGLKGHQAPFLIVYVHSQSCKVMQAPLDIGVIEI